MRHPFNYLSLLSLPALAALIYFPTGDADFLGFLGFLVFLRYLWVNPDELFLLTLRRTPTRWASSSWLSRSRRRSSRILVRRLMRSPCFPSTPARCGTGRRRSGRGRS